MIENVQCMVIVRSRRKAEIVASEISNYLSASKFFDRDTMAQLSIKQSEREKLGRNIRNSEPDLPICAQKLFGILKNGVAYHHAGLPQKYREMIEEGVRKGLVNVLSNYYHF